MSTFVLVHGAWQGGYVYARVARILRSAGHDVYTPTLTGLGERSHLAGTAINLDTHIQDILNVFRYERMSDVILCGHSYGGMVITGVASEMGEKIQSLIYLDAFAPMGGQSLNDITGPETTLAVLQQASVADGMIPPIPAAAFNVNAADAPWLDRLAVPQPLATFVQGVRVGVDSLPITDRTFVFAAANGGNWFEATYQRLKRHPSWQVHEIACGHNIMLDRPDDLAALLLQKAHT